MKNIKFMIAVVFIIGCYYPTYLGANNNDARNEILDLIEETKRICAPE